MLNDKVFPSPKYKNYLFFLAMGVHYDFGIYL